MPCSIIEYYAEHEQYKCGYCKRPNTNYSHGLWAHTMTVSDYQNLIDRGWRRSGKYCYKPTMDVTCCPMYTIRCHALEFKASKSQKKVLKRFNKFLAGEECSISVKEASRKMSTCSSGSEVLGEGFDEGAEQFVESTQEHHENVEITKNYEGIDHSDSESEEIVDKPTPQKVATTPKPQKSVIVPQNNATKDAGPDPSKAPCKKAKQLRRERKLEKLAQKGIDVSTLNKTNKNREKQFEEFINELPAEVKHKLEIKLVRTTPPSPEWLATAKETHEVYVKYQTTIHNENPTQCSEPRFNEFLVNSPLHDERPANGPPCGYGSFHQQYWVDGRIVAVGVIDILPKCVSSVYFFYDPQYMNLTPGTYGALREIAFTRYLHTVCPTIKYYYMGYYIHSCLKMRYKGSFHPSDLLCPETYKWFPIMECIPKLELSPYSRLDPNLDSVDENYPKDSDIQYIHLWVNGVIMLHKAYKRKTNKTTDPKELIEFARLVGAKAARCLVVVR